MEHYIWIAFWIVALGACRLQGAPLPLIEISDWTKIETIKCNDSTFYTPENVAKKCFITALNCVVAELNGTASIDCTESEKEISEAVDTLTHVISVLMNKTNLTVNDSADCDCHNWSEKSLKTFVDSVTSLLQKINAEV